MFGFGKLLKAILMFGPIGFQMVAAQTIITTVLEGDDATHNGVVQVIRGTGSMEWLLAQGGDIAPNHPAGLHAALFGDEDVASFFAGTTLVSQTIAEGEPTSPNDPNAILAVRVHTAALQATYFVEQGVAMNADDPTDLPPRTIVIYTQDGASPSQLIVEQSPPTDPNDPDGLTAAQAAGATVNYGLFGNTQVITVVEPANETEAHEPLRIHVHKTLL